MSRGDAEFAEGGERAKAELRFSPGFVGYFAVEVCLCECGSLVPVSAGEGFANFGQQVCRLLVLIPIVCRSFRRVGTAAPERLLVERVAFHGDRAHDVAAQTAVAKGQRGVFPFAVGIGVPLSRTDGFEAGSFFVFVSLPPDFASLQRSGAVKAHHLLGADVESEKRKQKKKDVSFHSMKS